MPKRKAEIFYGIHNGKSGNTVCKSWDEALKNISGSKGCKHRKFSSMSEAEAFSETGSIQLQPEDTDDVIVYVDGTCTGSIAGYGVWFGDGHPHNAFERIDDITSQLAELRGAIKTLELIIKHLGVDVPCRVRTDSQYVVKAVTDYIPRLWLPNEWKTKPNKNKEDMQGKDYCCLGSNNFEHLYGHCGKYGNERAHKLADKVYTLTEPRFCYEKNVEQ